MSEGLVGTLRAKALIIQIAVVLLPVAFIGFRSKRWPTRLSHWATIASAVASLPLLAVAKECAGKFWDHPDFGSCGEVLVVVLVTYGSLAGCVGLLRYLYSGYDVTVFGQKVFEKAPETKAEQKPNAGQQAAE